MKIRLRVLAGRGVGHEIQIPTPVCLIGRGDECHLRPRSEAVSRRHCKLLVAGGRVVVRDLHSRNGTFVNEEPVRYERIVKPGDTLQVGPLEFQFLIEYGLQGPKKPPVTSVREATERLSKRDHETETIGAGDVTRWLEENDRSERERRLREPDTTRLILDDTQVSSLQENKRADGTGNVASLNEPGESQKPRGPKFGKLPKPEMAPSQDSSEAAAKAIRRYLNG